MHTRFAVFAVVLCACPGSDSGMTDTEEPSEISVVLDSDERGAWLSAWQADDRDIWIVGGQPEAGAVLVGNAVDGFSALDLPEGTPLLNWVHGTRDTDVWVGGVQGTLLHYDGSAWTDHSLGIEEAIWGLYARDTDSVWAVGGASSFGGEVARVYLDEGEGFVELALPDELSDLDNFFKVSHDGERAWLVGAAGAAAYAEDGVLTAIPTGYGRDLVTVAADAEPIVVVGGRGTGVIFQADGTSLSKVVDAPSGLSGVDHLGYGRLVVAGEYGYVGIFDPSDASLEEVSTGTDAVLHGVLVTDAGDVYAVGGNLYTAGDSYEGTVLYGQLEAR